jgi:phage shock protein E
MQRRTVLALALAATLVAPTLAACGGEDSTASLSSATAAASAPAAGSSLAPAEFAAAAKRTGTTLLDVRTAAEFAQGHLPGAKNLDVSAPDFTAQIARLDPTATYAVYCHSGNRSATALSLMAQAGFRSAFDLAGGVQAWQQAGGDLVTS